MFTQQPSILTWSVSFQPSYFITSSYFIFCDFKDNAQVLAQVKTTSTKLNTLSIFNVITFVGTFGSSLFEYLHNWSLVVVFAGISFVSSFAGNVIDLTIFINGRPACSLVTGFLLNILAFCVFLATFGLAVDKLVLSRCPRRDFSWRFWRT